MSGVIESNPTRIAAVARRLRSWLLAAVATLLTLPAMAQIGQIALVGVGAQTDSQSSGALTPALPSGTAAGDFAVLVVAGRPSDTAVPNAPTGWSQRSAVINSGSTLRLVTYYKALVAGEPNPAITIPSSWASNTTGISGQIAVWRGVNTSTPFDVNDATNTATAAATFTAPAITTANYDALVVSVVVSADDNALGLSTANGFTARMSGAAYDTTSGADHAMGLADDAQALPGAVTMPIWTQTANGNDAWAGITFALRASVPATLRLSMNLDETAWNGTAGQVVDGSTYGLNGRAFGGATTANATPAITANPGTCRYGVFDGTDDYVEIADTAALDITNELTMAAWVYMRTVPAELHTIMSKDTNSEFHIDPNRRVYWWWNDSSGNTRSITTTNAITLNTWTHIAVTYSSGTQRIYINGALQGTTGNYTGTLATNTASLFIGTDLDFLSRVFDGYIDEPRVYADALTQAQVQALQTETHPCANSARFTITHNAFGINCVAETITVNVVDAVAGTPLVNYNSAVQLDTQTGFGTWSLVTGTGTFSDGTANDGIATYTWPLGASQATFSLYYPQGSQSMDVDVFQISNTAIRDNDAEGNLVFYPNGFTVTAAALANPPGTITQFATNQTAGTNFNLYLAAYGQTPADPVCGIIEAYTGTKNVKFWSHYVDPNTGTRNATINGTSAAATEGASVAQSVTFANGQALVTAKYKDVGRIRIAMKDDTVTQATELPSGIVGATANFVVRPYDFLLSGIANSANTLANPQATTATDAVFLAAGAPFRMTVTVRDAEGSTTPNYGRESSPEGVRLPTQIFAPSGGAAPAIGSTTGFGTFTNGVATGTDFTWAEVGIMRAVPGVGDNDYLQAGDVTGPVSDRIGRFVPARFVAGLNAPVLTTQCTAGAFTYQGQPFGYTTAPVITATAVAVGGSTTTNYTGAFFKLTNTSLTGRSYTGAGTLNVAGLPATTSDPAIASPSGGVATLTFSAGSGLSFVKGTPVAPFNAQVQLAINVADSDGVVAVGAAPLGNPVTFGSSGGIVFNNGQQIRYGRVRIGTAVGSELVDLAVPMLAEYYASTAAGFVTHTADTCSTNIALSFSGYTESLNAGETCVRDSGSPGASALGCAAVAASPFREPPVAGDFNLRLAAPGAGNQGSVLIRGSVPAWLRFDWDSGTAGVEDPTGQATFGIYGGERRTIYTREIY